VGVHAALACAGVSAVSRASGTFRAESQK